MASIFSLYGSIFIDNEKANTAIDQTTNKGKDSEKSFASSVGSMAKSAVKMGAAIVTGTTAAVGGLMALANKTADTADTFDKSSLRTGLQVEELQRLNYAAGQSGVELSTLEKSAKKLNDRLGEVSEGNSKSAEMFEQLGVSVKNADGTMRSTTDIYNDTIARLADMGDTAEATAIGTDLFGKAFTDMKPLLAEGSEGINELKNRADELGIVMSEDAVNAGVVFGNTLSDIKQALGGLFNSIMSSLIPVIQQVLDLIIQNMPTIQNLISTLAPILGNLLSSLLPPLMDLAQAIFPILIELINQLLPFITQIIEAILPVIIDLLNMLLPPIMQIVELILPLLLSLIQPLLPLLQPIFQLLQPFIDVLMALLVPLIDLINMILPPIINLLTMIINAILPPLQAALNVTASILTNVFGGAFRALQPIINNLKNILSGIISFITGVFTGNWRKAWDGVKQIFSNIISGLTNIFKAPINFIIDGINVFIKGLNKLKIPDWVPGIGGKGINIPLMNKLRVGMEYVPYDEMPALLHKGERVLTADENKDYTNQQSAVTNNEVNNIFNLTVNSPKELSPAEVARQTRKAYQEYNLKYGKA